MTALKFGFQIPAWHDDAACRPELWVGRVRPDFLPGRGASGAVAAARAVCDHCPVVEECLAEALANPWMVGVWGGTSDRQRVMIRRRRAMSAA